MTRSHIGPSQRGIGPSSSTRPDILACPPTPYAILTRATWYPAERRALPRRVAITGIGVVSPAGRGLPLHVRALRSGKSLVRKIPRLQRAELGVNIAAQVPTTTKLPYSADPHVSYALAAVQDALLQATLPSTSRKDAAVIFGTAIAGTNNMERFYDMIGPPIPDSFAFGTLAECISNQFGLLGLISTLSTGCTAGLDSIGIALDVLHSNAANVVIAGASDAPLTPVVIAAFDRIGVLARENARPERASRPLDKNRSGFVIGEGAAAFVLESEEHARDRNATILATILGYSSVSSAYHMTGMRDDGEDIARAISESLLDASVTPGSITLIDMHGTGTRMNDYSEAKAIEGVFYTQGLRPLVTAQKSIMGHALGASNALEVAGLLGMLNSCICLPPANLTRMDDKISVETVTIPTSIDPASIAVKISSGFSGIHSALVLRGKQDD